MSPPRLILPFALSLLIPAAAAQTTSRESLGVTGAEGNNISYGPRVSGDGRFVVFETQATNLIPGDSNSNRDVLVRDRLLGTTAVISVNSAGEQGTPGAGSHAPDISAGGRHVVFHSYAGNFGSMGDTTGVADIFLRDRDPDANLIYDESSSTTEQVSINMTGSQPNGGSQSPRISDDGTLVAFDSAATDLVTAGGAGGGEFAVFARDLTTGTNVLISIDLYGLPAMGRVMDVSGDGRYVLFWSTDPDLVAADTNGAADVFVRDRVAAATSRVSEGTGGVQGTHNSTVARMSEDGRFIAFYSKATNLVAGGIANTAAVYLRDRDPDGDGLFGGNGITELISLNSLEVEGMGAVEPTFAPSLSDDGRYVAFAAGDSPGSCCDLVVEDVNGNFDVFLRDRTAGVTTRLSVDGDGAAMGGKSWEPDLDAGGDVLVFSTWSALAGDDLNTHEDVYSRDQSTWRDRGWNMAGSTAPPPGGSVKSVPVLTGSGTLAGGSSGALTLAAAKKGATSFLFAGASELSLSFRGGVLVPYPDLIIGGLVVSSPATPFGGWELPFTWPAGVASDLEFFFQAWVVDSAGPNGLVSSNALSGLTP